MISLITLAHQVSTIHAGYADIHAAVFPSSFAWLRSRSNRLTSQYCEHEKVLTDLTKELSRVFDVTDHKDEIRISSTSDHDFVSAMREYIEALTAAIGQLAEICRRLCLESNGTTPYGETESREARIAYDQSIQRYQRFGQRLSRRYEKL